LEIIPTKLMVRVLAVAGTLNLNFPSTSVIVPMLVPATITVAPGIGTPWLSLTVPLTCFCCSTGLITCSGFVFKEIGYLLRAS